MSVVKRKKPGTLLLVAMLVAFLLLMQFVIFYVDRTPWFDVAFSLETVHKLRVEGLSSIDFSTYDVHSSFSYYMQYFWSYLNPGISEYHWGQELSVLYGLIFFIFIFFGLSKMFGRPGEYAAYSMVFLTTYIHYFSEIRMYSLVLMLSSIIFYAVARRLEGRWLAIACVAVFLLPFVHYMACMVVPFFALMYVVREKYFNKSWSWKVAKDRMSATLLLIAGSIGIFVTAIVFLIPQRSRIVAMWLPTSSLASWPSSLLFTFFMTDGMVPSVFASIIYIVFLALIVLLLVWIWFALSKKDVEYTTIALMLLTGIYPILGLIASKWIDLYHHRFFLVVTWMFAAGVLLLLHRYRAFEPDWKKIGLVLLVLGVCMGMFMKYAIEQPDELKNLMAATPCNGNGIMILHESPFSSLTYSVFARENNCNWLNVVSTDLNRAQANSAGFDIIPDENIYWEHSIPKSSFYYVKAEFELDKGLPSSIVMQEDGVALVYVRQLSLVSIQVK